MLKKSSIFSKPYIGVFSSTSESLTIISKVDEKEEEFNEALETPVIKTTIGGTRVIGSLICTNSNGVMVPDITEEREIEPILDHLEVRMVPNRLNAMGNNILLNDYGALIHPDLNKKVEKVVKSLFQVDVKRGSIAGVNMVGSIAVATNQGVLCHPHVDEDEKQMMEELFDVPVMKTTANHGSAWIGTCLVANTKGAVIGDRTTPIEMGRIEEGLGYI